MDPRVEALKERAWRETAAIDAELAAGRVDEAGWHAAMAALVAPAYLAGSSPYAQAGHSGDAASWEASRGFIARAIHRSGTFLDAGCASGILMESVVRWGRHNGHDIEPFGVEIVPALAELARRRLPRWADRIAVGNIRAWRPAAGGRFDFVLIRPEYAPKGRRADMVRHVLEHVLAPQGRLIVFAGTEELGVRSAEAEVAAGGFTIHGRAERIHPEHASLRRRLFWLTAARARPSSARARSAATGPG
jgi:hypothetical protein